MIKIISGDCCERAVVGIFESVECFVNHCEKNNFRIELNGDYGFWIYEGDSEDAFDECTIAETEINTTIWDSDSLESLVNMREYFVFVKND